MSLKDKLEETTKGFMAQVPPEVATQMGAATQQLRESGILDRVLKVGAKMPSFQMKNQADELISSDTLLGKGPLVLTFYRGKW